MQFHPLFSAVHKTLISHKQERVTALYSSVAIFKGYMDYGVSHGVLRGRNCTMGEKLSHWVIDLNFATVFFVFHGTPWVDATVSVCKITTEFRGRLTTLPWHTAEHRGTPRHTVAHRGTPWHTVAHRGTPLHTVAHLGTPWHTVAHHGTPLHTMAHPCTPW